MPLTPPALVRSRDTVTSPPEVHVVVAGCGPAGLLLAIELAERGVRVTAIDPRLSDPWPANYGCWLDQVDDTPLAHAVQHRCPIVVLQDEDGAVPIPRSYAVIDTPRLQAQLVRRCRELRVRLLEDRVQWWRAQQRSVRIETAGVGPLQADLLVDAAGHLSHVDQSQLFFNVRRE